MCSRACLAGRAAAGLLIVAVAAGALRADPISSAHEDNAARPAAFKADGAKPLARGGAASSSRLRWRSPATGSDVFAEPAPAQENSGQKSHRQETAGRFVESKPAAPKISAKGAFTVKRLADADPSPHSSAAGRGGSTLSIIQTAHEEPRIDPFADEEKVEPPPKKAREQRRAVQAVLQEDRADPFTDEPRMERGRQPRQPQEIPQTEVAQGPRAVICPTPRDLKPLSQISTNIAAEPGEFPAECGLGDDVFATRSWPSTVMAWKASALCHKPLYFEDVELERYGQTCSPLFQPALSAAKFWLTVPILPYKFGLEPPCECIYVLGYYRPGSCAPFIIPPVPISVRGALLEAGAWVAGVAIVP